MTSDRNQFEGLFPEAYRNFEVEQLFADLAKSLNKDHIKASLLGKLCHYSREETAKKIGFAPGTIGRDLSDKVYPAIGELLQLEEKINWTKVDLSQLLAKYRKSFKDSLSVNIPWQQVCREVLEKQQKQRLTSYPLGSGAREMPEMYVPLELVEREEKPRVCPELDPEKWSAREQEKRTPISNQEFLEQVFQGKSLKSNGKRIAVIGEPGAGKTTLLQKIASEVKELPIWIDLADLDAEKHQSLQDYLLETWLTKWALPTIRKLCPEAAPYPRIATEELKDALIEEFEQGHVWLLLDGADEMAAKFGQPLTWITQQLRAGWITEAKVILSCRLNLWSIEGDYLPNFDVYRNVDFTDEQVEEFIEKWFAKEPDSCKKLKEERNLANQRIKNLIRNPLRLTLLCLTWKNGGEKLPDTTVGLYQRLVEGHYNWKRDKEGFVILPEKQKELNQWLGELAKDTLDSKESRFRLRKSSIESFLAKHNQDSSLRDLAIKLGWLIEIGLPSEDEKDADEPVYAFFHPTFQEYFAALNIPSWDDFLPCDHNNNNPKPVDGKKYRIFEPQWNGVFSLWLQRGDVDTNDKEKFIEALVNFNDGIDHLNFYSLKSYYLAQDGLSHFTGSKFHENFPIQDLFFEDGEEILYEEEVNYFLERTAPPRTIYDEIMNQELQYLLPQFERLGTSWEEYVSHNLIPSKETEGNKLDNDQSNLEQINDLNVLVKLLETENRWAVIQRLLKIADAQPKTVIDTLTKAIDSNRGNIYINSSIAWILGGLALGDLETVKTLIRLIQNSKDYLTQWLVAQSIQANLISEKQFIIKNEKQMRETVLQLRKLYGFSGIYTVLEYCAKKMSYPDFYDAWYEPTTTHPEAPDNIPVGKSSITQLLNFTQLPSILDSVIAKDEELNKAVKLICIDIKDEFSNPDMLAAYIYSQMVNQGCPECPQGRPTNMPLLSIYWDLDLRKLEKRVALLFYNSKNDRTLNPSFLSDIATFGGTIAIISDRPCENVRLISPNDPNLIDTVLKWLRREVLET
ncbi:NACHT domain-containing protein [Floridanema evergladense]|uniref:NACHT domain-containing NTPase n=1 Tax=Floridaenema evergladense BLCC-F167 TaxID=3153639 RepID=A0ABV4WW49_9CYAN